MIDIDLTNKDIITDNSSLFQWDYGQKLSISGLSNTENIQVHFARTGKAEIRIGTISSDIIIVDIPDTLLQKSGMIKAYIYVSDSESGETIKIINLNVREREQPTDYTSPDYVDVVAELNAKLNKIIETGIAQYEPDPSLVDTLVTEKLNAIIGNMATKDEVAKTDLTSALVTEIDGKLNTSKVVKNLAVTEYGFVPDAKTVSDAVGALNNNLAAYLMRGIVASGLIADVNLCTSKGTYEVFGSNADVSNLPTIEGTIYGILEVNVGNTGGAFAWQKLRTITGTEYNRYCVNGSWSTWI